jgi:hypothetical protein
MSSHARAASGKYLSRQQGRSGPALHGFALVATCGAAGWELAHLLAHERRAAEPVRTRPAVVTLSCGKVEHRRGSSLRHSGFGWPLGRLKLDDAELVGYTPLLFGRGRIRVRYEEIDEAR